MKLSSGSRRGVALAAFIVALAAVYQATRYFSEEGARPDPDGGERSAAVRLWNMHEHIADLPSGARYLAAARRSGIRRTLILGDFDPIFTRESPTSFAGAADNNEEVLQIAAAYPGEFLPFVLVSPERVDLENLQALFRRGAKGVHVRALPGSMRFRPDHPKLWPVYGWCEQAGIPVVLHYGNGRSERLQNVLRNFPRLRVNVPHLLYGIGRPAYVRRMFDRYPNLYTDMTYGYFSWMKQSFQTVSRKSDQLRSLVLKYPDRFLWGTDHVVSSGPVAGAQPLLEEIFDTYRNLFERERFRFPSAELYELRGLHLPAEVLESIYSRNALRFLEGPSKEAVPIRRYATRTVLLTGSSLFGEGMARKGPRLQNALIPAPELMRLTRSADLLHISNETVFLDHEPAPEEWKFYSTAADWKLFGQLGADVVELTGNHLLDYGPEPLRRTIGAIQAGLLGYFGGGLNEGDALHPLTVRKGDHSWTFVGFGMIAQQAHGKMPGSAPFDRKKMVDAIGRAKAEGSTVIVSFQWGDEFNPQPGFNQRLTAYAAVEAGADVVIGTHSHVFLGYERYRGKPIFYGLGNFLFRDDRTLERRTGGMIRIRGKAGEDPAVDILPVRNINGTLTLLRGKARAEALRRWDEHTIRLSTPEKASLRPHLAYLRVLEPAHLSLLSRFASRGGIRSADLFVPADRYADFQTSARAFPVNGVTADSEPQLRAAQDLVEAGKVKAVELRLPPGTFPARMYGAVRWSSAVVFGPAWKLSDIARFLDAHPEVTQAWADVSLRSQARSAANPAAKRLSFLWRGEEAVELPGSGLTDVALGFDPSFDKTRSDSRNITRAVRRFFGLRNRLENERYFQPLANDDGAEWGYNYRKEISKKGLNLPVDVLARLYRRTIAGGAKDTRGGERLSGVAGNREKSLLEQRYEIASSAGRADPILCSPVLKKDRSSLVSSRSGRATTQAHAGRR